MRKLRPFLIIILLVCLCTAGYAGYEYYKKLKPNEEVIPSGELFDVAGNEAAIILNSSLAEEKGVFDSGIIYLPLEWVNMELNNKFYWDETEHMLIYTFPDHCLYAGPDTCGSSGRLLLYEKGGRIYISSELLAAYTKVNTRVYTDEEAPRIFIETMTEPYQTAEITRSDMLRTGESVKKRCIIPIAEGETVRIINDSWEGASDIPKDAWVRVLTDSGYQGYFPRKYLGSRTTVTPFYNYEAPEYASTHLDYPIILGWQQINDKQQNSNVAKLLEGTTVNVISPTWFSLRGNAGDYESLADRSYVDEAHAMGLSVWALIDNFDSSVNSDKLFRSKAAREKLAASLIQDAEKYDLDGINIDFEQMPTAAGPHFIQFLREFSILCRQEGIILSVDNANPAPHNLYYQRADQAEVVDYVINMGYDEHYAGSDAGSVSSFPFFKEGIDVSLSMVPAEKLIGGLPLYTRIWTVKGSDTTSKAVGLDAAAEWVSENNVSLTWDENCSQYTGSISTDSGTLSIWMEDAESLAIKVQAIKEADLAGIACWKLGLKSDGVWNVIRY